MRAAPRCPWTVVSCVLAVLSATATAQADLDGCALMQVDVRMASASSAGQLPGDAAQLRAEMDAKVVNLHDSAHFFDDRLSSQAEATRRNILMLKEAGKLEFTTNLIRELSKEMVDKGQPIDFSAMMSNPTIINGLLMGDLTKAIIDLANQQSAPQSNDARNTELLNGHSLLFNNLAVIVILACVCIMPFIGHKLDGRTASDEEKPRRFSYRIGFLLLASYLIWIPAIFSADFSFNIGFVVPVTGQRVGITQDEHHGWVPGPIHESTRTLVHLLWTTRAHVGAILIAIYAFIVPTVKLILLGIGELFRFSETIWLRRLARYCICLMQFISKWAAPDMFAYVLLYYLIRRLQNLPVSTLCMFDIGFTCYSVFSITCAISSLGVPLPKIESDEVVKEVKPPLVRRMIAGSFESPGAEKRRLLVLVGLLATVWACLFVYGLGVPCFALRLDADLLKDHVPDGMKQVLKMIKLNKIIFPQNVSLVQAMGSLMYWFATDHDLNILLGFVMLAVFAVTLTALNMANLIRTAWQLSKENQIGNHPCPAMARSEVLKHLSMMDVLLMGIIVGTFAGGIYRDEGIVIYIRSGIWVLVGAEVMHYLTYYCVSSLADYETKVATIHAKIINYVDGENDKRVLK